MHSFHRLLISTTIALLLAVSGAAQRLAFHHTPDIAGQYWLDATTEKLAPEGTHLYSPKAKAHLFYGTPIGAERQLVHVLRAWQPDEQITIDDWAKAGPTDGFRLHPWIGGSLHGIAPHVDVVIAGTKHELTPQGMKITVDHQNVAQMAVQLRGRVPGTMLVFEGWLVAYTNSPLVERAWRLVQSDPTTTAMDCSVDLAWLEWGDVPVVDHGAAYGVGTYKTPSGTWAEVLPAPFVMGDATTTDWFRGAILCSPDEPGELTDPKNRLIVTAAYARAQGREWGLDLDVQNWLANRAAPDVAALPAAQNAMEATKELQQWSGWSKGPISMFGGRPWGLFPYSGTTGNQPPFGATQGTLAVSMHDPLAVRRYLDWCTSPYRPYHYRTATGDVLPATTAGLRYWNQHIHWNSGQSPYRHGKPYPEPSSNTHGWTGMDDQHYDGLTLCTAYALTGVPWLRQELEERLVVHQAALRDHAPRAIGRVLLELGNLAVLLPSASANVALDQAQRFLDEVEAVRPTETQQGARPLNTIICRYAPIQGKFSVCPWEHGIACLGLSATRNGAIAIGRPTLAKQAEGMLKDACETVMLIGYQPVGSGGALVPQTYVEWNPTAYPDVPAMLYPPPPLPLATGGGVSAFWYLPAAVCASQLPPDPADAAWTVTQQRAATALSDSPPATWEDIEWLAIRL